jgi:hypothetical protein
MNYKELVERKIAGKSNELERRRRIWREIVGSYEQGGQEAIKSVLIKRSDNIIKEFDKLLKQLREKL